MLERFVFDNIGRYICISQGNVMDRMLGYLDNGDSRSVSTQIDVFRNCFFRLTGSPGRVVTCMRASEHG